MPSDQSAVVRGKSVNRNSWSRGLPSRIVLSAFLAASAGGAALAQDSTETEDTYVLEPITVLGNQEDATGPVTDKGNPPTVTGSKVPVYANEVPQSLSVLGKEDLERFNADRVSETLRYTAGMMTDVFGDDNDTDWMRIRGFQADQNGIYLDNAQNLAFAFGSFYTDPYALERIEVLRGPSSALYGGSNPGGIVNYVSKRPGVRIRETVLQGKDAPSGSIAFDVGDPLDNGEAYRVVGRFEGGDKYDEFNHGERYTFAPSYKVTAKNGTELTFLANLHVADEKHNGSTFLPYHGTVRRQSFGYIDDDENFSDPDWDSYRREQFSATAIVEHTFVNDFTFTAIGRAGVASVEESYWYPGGYTGFAAVPADNAGTLSIIGFEHDTLTRTAQTDVRYYGIVETGPVEHDLLFGVDARYYWLDETQAFGFGTTSVTNPINPGAPALGAPFQDATSTQTQVGLYFQDQLRFGDGWIVTGNLRFDRVHTEQDGANGFARRDGKFSYRAAVAYDFSQGITPYVTYSTSFNPQITSPANGVTKPETGEQIETGFKWAPNSGNMYVNAAIFQINRNDVVTGVNPNFEQIGEIRSRGAELEGGYDFRNGLTVATALTYLDVEILDDKNASLIGKTPTLTPDHELTLRADYAFGGVAEGLTLGAGVRHRGESYADTANTLDVPDSTIFDLYGSYQVVENAELNLSATNIADRRYVTGCQTETVCSYGSGREVTLSLRANW
ncbi:MAG: TonB-dependent siderophore receptor [Alphaproteobacteria bacterium]|nr:TonB-dependent siderophore receptor [Alphaproteobacteria bacterium]MBO6861232.1 TonB-dependent siderophore receptor [Alphaproteobacteria bacterium]